MCTSCTLPWAHMCFSLSFSIPIGCFYCKLDLTSKCFLSYETLFFILNMYNLLFKVAGRLLRTIYVCVSLRYLCVSFLHSVSPFLYILLEVFLFHRVCVGPKFFSLFYVPFYGPFYGPLWAISLF